MIRSRRSPIAASGIEAPGEESASQELDPLELLDLGSKRPPPKRNAPKARDLDRGSLLDGHYRPPDLVPAPSFGSPAERDIDSGRLRPAGAGDDCDLLPPHRSPPAATAAPSRARQPRPGRSERRRHRRRRRPTATAAATAGRTIDRRPTPPPPGTSRAVESMSSRSDAAVDFGAVLAGAGLDPADVTPELARDFGQILRVVVSGVMDVMRSRQQIKDEFRMRMTRVRRGREQPAQVFRRRRRRAAQPAREAQSPPTWRRSKRSKTPLPTLRNHQIAMLAGMRVAFESMLAEFDPDRLQQEFDRQLGKGLVPAKLRYWDLYRERRQRDRQGSGSELPPIVRRGVRAGVRRAAQAAQGPTESPGAGGPAAPSRRRHESRPDGRLRAARRDRPSPHSGGIADAAWTNQVIRYRLSGACASTVMVTRRLLLTVTLIP